MPEYTRGKMDMAEMKRQQGESERQNLVQKQQQGNLNPDEQRRLIVGELKGYMADPEISGYINQQITESTAARGLINDTEFVIEDYADQGLPRTTVQDLLNHIHQTAIKNP